MTDTTPDITPVLAKARAMKIPFYESGQCEYDTHVQVKNDRIKTAPRVIAPCKDADTYSFWLRELQGYRIPISIRSGGHHHEGMCSNTGGIVLLALHDPDMKIDLENNRVWLGAGQPLGKVIKALGHKGRVLPTGGCSTVNVGGLTHGGGWGMSYRTWGLTSDALRAVEMVLPNGDKVVIGPEGLISGSTSLDVDPNDLFWAICGGGGGNFGVATRFLFEIFDPGLDHYTEFTLQWDAAAGREAAVLWAQLCDTACHKLNSFARMTVMDDVTHKFYNPPFLVAGRYYGDEAECRDALADLLSGAPPKTAVFDTKPLAGADGALGALMLGNYAAPRLEDGTEIPWQGYALQLGAPKPSGPSDTCVETPEPHKVSSVLPGADHAALLQDAADYIEASDDVMDANLYLSLHGMGGEGGKKPESDGAFPWRHKAYILQAQAWWNPGSKSSAEEQALLDWVDGLRLVLEKHGEGAFINFPDENQPVHQYYGHSWPRLCAIKRQVDPHNRLRFPMSIPPIFVEE